MGAARMVRTVSTLAILLAATAAVVAQTDVIGERQQIMKSFGAATGQASKMAKGETPFDLAKAKEYLQTYATGAQKVASLFPPGSNAGKETAASPKIWENRAGFEKDLAEFRANAEKAASATTDLESFRANFGAVTRGCGGCHQDFRLKKG